MNRYLRVLSLAVLMSTLMCPHQVFAEPQIERCDVVILGGTTAALSAAIEAADEKAQTCLIEPVDWIGGQSVVSVPAIDFSHSNVKIKGTPIHKIAKSKENNPKESYHWIRELGNPGKCWVSNSCFNPKELKDRFLEPKANSMPLLRIFKNTVVKEVETTNEGRQIVSLSAILRQPKEPTKNTGYEGFLHKNIEDWYSYSLSDVFHKKKIIFKGKDGRTPIFIDASEFGELLALSGDAWLQGVETGDGRVTIANETCGQAMVFPFAMKYNTRVSLQSDPKTPVPYPQFYDQLRNTPNSNWKNMWEYVWNYRRSQVGFHNQKLRAGPGDVSVQNWNPGNDYPYEYLFLDVEQTKKQRSDWKGGVSISAIKNAEFHSLGWYKLLKNHPQAAAFKEYLSLDMSFFGTGTGLSKLPYVRDTRRSIGLNNYIMPAFDMYRSPHRLLGKPYKDRVAIGHYALDVHALKSCDLPDYIVNEVDEHAHTLRPFFIPLRALTNRDVENLLVAGKTMAQSFLANAAIRLHPIEWQTGMAAGISAAYMVHRNISRTKDLLPKIKDLQFYISEKAPINWTIKGKVYPSADAVLDPLPNEITCPNDTWWDSDLGYCVDDVNAYGIFPNTMSDMCIKNSSINACKGRILVTYPNGSQLKLQRWSKTFTRSLRGSLRCPRGAYVDNRYYGRCVERSKNPFTDKVEKNIYGPFPKEAIDICVAEGGGAHCYTQRWDADFFRNIVKTHGLLKD